MVMCFDALLIISVCVAAALFDWLLIKGGTHKEKELEKHYEAAKETDS